MCSARRVPRIGAFALTLEGEGARAGVHCHELPGGADCRRDVWRSGIAVTSGIPARGSRAVRCAPSRLNGAQPDLSYGLSHSRLTVCRLLPPLGCARDLRDLGRLDHILRKLGWVRSTSDLSLDGACHSPGRSYRRAGSRQARAHTARTSLPETRGISRSNVQVVAAAHRRPSLSRSPTSQLFRPPLTPSRYG